MRLIKFVFEVLLFVFVAMTLITDLQSQSPGQTPPAAQTPARFNLLRQPSRNRPKRRRPQPRWVKQDPCAGSR